MSSTVVTSVRPLSPRETVDAIVPLIEAGATHVIIEQAEIDQ